jgi:chromosome segregation ATPase
MAVADTQALQAEINHLQEEVELRDQLVQQLSQELFRLIKGHPRLTGTSHSEAQELHRLKGQIQAQEAEILQLRQVLHDLTERSRLLEQLLQELPQVYRQKFEARMAALKEKVAIIQQERQELYAQLQTVQANRLALPPQRSYRNVELPNFPKLEPST